MNKEYIGLVIREGIMEDKLVLYLYEIASAKYQGFINLTQVLELTSVDTTLDFLFSSNKIKGSIIIYANNMLYLMS